jgi:hypothetical protein
MRLLCALSFCAAFVVLCMLTLGGAWAPSVSDEVAAQIYGAQCTSSWTTGGSTSYCGCSGNVIYRRDLGGDQSTVMMNCGASNSCQNPEDGGTCSETGIQGRVCGGPTN